MLKNKITDNVAGLNFWFYWEQRGERVWATFHIGDEKNFKQKSREITNEELETILKVIKGIPENPSSKLSIFDYDWGQARYNSYCYRWEVFMPLVKSFFAEDWTKLI